MREQLVILLQLQTCRRQGARARDRREAAPRQARSAAPRSREAPGHARRRARQARRDRDLAQVAAGADRPRARRAQDGAEQAPGVEEHARSSAPRAARSRTSASRSAIARPSSRRSSRRPPQSTHAARRRATRTSQTLRDELAASEAAMADQVAGAQGAARRGARPRATPRAAQVEKQWLKTYDTLVGQARLRGRAGDQGRVPGLPHGAAAAAQQHPRAHGVDRDLPALRPPRLSQGAARAAARPRQSRAAALRRRLRAGTPSRSAGLDPASPRRGSRGSSPCPSRVATPASLQGRDGRQAGARKARSSRRRRGSRLRCATRSAPHGARAPRSPLMLAPQPQRSSRSASANSRSRRVSMMFAAARAIAATGLRRLAREERRRRRRAPAHHRFAISTPFITARLADGRVEERAERRRPGVEARLRRAALGEQPVQRRIEVAAPSRACGRNCSIRFIVGPLDAA